MKRLQVIVNDEMAEKIDFYAEKMSVSRSSLCCMFIGQMLMSYDKSFDVLDKIGVDLSDKFVTDVTK